MKYGDLNGDGLVDFVKFNGQFASITYQWGQSEVDPVPVIEPDPVVDPGTVVEGEVPAIDANAYEVGLADTIAEIKDNSVVLSSGKILWLNSETIIKFNDASGFEVGQTLQFKAWMNPDGALIGIKVEVA